MKWLTFILAALIALCTFGVALLAFLALPWFAPARQSVNGYIGSTWGWYAFFIISFVLLWNSPRIWSFIWTHKKDQDTHRREEELHQERLETIKATRVLVQQAPVLGFNYSHHNTFTGEQIAFTNPYIAKGHAPIQETEDTKEIGTSRDTIPEYTAPSQDYAINQLRENALEVCMGISAETGKPHIQDLLKGTHYKFIGSSGMGKSCLAGSMLDQATQTNDAAHLQIALLDLEHKTSRLFENLPHIAELQVGRKRVQCVATDADEVGEHLGYLHQELDRRKQLSEYDLYRQRFLLIYLEEFVSLKYEIDPKLLANMFADFSILALRGRKYGMFFLACAQVDYAAKAREMQEAQNQFNAKGSFSVKPSAARAAGFSDTDLLNENFKTKKYGKFVYETTGVSSLMLAPDYDVRVKLLRLDARSGSVHRPFSGPETEKVNAVPNPPERATTERSGDLNALLNVDENTLKEMQHLDAMGWTKQEIVEKLWNCKKGSSKDWQEGSQVYDAAITKKKVGA